MLINTHRMQARNNQPNVNSVSTLKHFFPCLDSSRLIDTKGGIIYTPQSVSYNTTKKTITSGDDLDEARAIDSGSVYDFGQNSFGVVVVGDINTINASRPSSILLGDRTSAGATNPAIFVGASTTNELQASGFNDNNEIHFTARHLNTVSEGDTYIMTLTCDRENNKITSKIFNITSNRFDTYTEISILPMTDATFNSGGVNAKQVATSSTVISDFGIGDNLSARAYSSGEVNSFQNLTVDSSAANALTVSDDIAFTQSSPTETMLQDGVTSVRRYPDEPNAGNQNGSAIDVSSAAACSPSNFMKASNLAMYGAAYYSFENGIPSDWDFAANWQAWAWVQGYRVPYPNAVEWK